MTGRRAALAAIVVAAGPGCGEPLPLSNTSQALVSVSPVSWEFGDVMIGGEPGGRVVAIAPAPDDNLDTVAGIVLDCPGFAYDLRGIALPFEVSRTCEGAPPDCATEAYR